MNRYILWQRISEKLRNTARLMVVTSCRGFIPGVFSSSQLGRTARISAEEIFSTGTIFSFDPLPVKQFRDLSTYPCRSVFSIVTFTSLEISPPSLPLKIVGDILNLRSNARLRYSNSSFRGKKRGDVRSIRRVVNASISARSLEIDSRMKNTSDSPILSLLLSASMSSNAALSFFLDRSSSIETKKIAFDRNSYPQIGFIRE